jgi:hypothetical protein
MGKKLEFEERIFAELCVRLFAFEIENQHTHTHTFVLIEIPINSG